MRWIYSFTREPLGYFVDILQIGSYLYLFVFFIAQNYTKFFELSQWSTIILGGAFIFLLIGVLRKTRRIIEDIHFTASLSSLGWSLKQQNLALRSKGYIQDYEKIIPKTSILRYLYKKTKFIAKRWSKDCLLKEIRLSISSLNMTNGLNIDAYFRFFSPLKRMTMDITTPNLQLPKNKIPRVDQFRYEDDVNNTMEIRSFFEDFYWRQVLIAAFQRMESELVGKEFTCSVDSVFYPMWIQFMPKGIIARNYVFIYDKGKLLEGYGKNAPVLAIFQDNLTVSG